MSAPLQHAKPASRHRGSTVCALTGCAISSSLLAVIGGSWRSCLGAAAAAPAPPAAPAAGAA